MNASWGMGAFLIGIVLHGLRPYAPIQFFPVLLAVGIGCFGWLIHGTSSKIVRIVCLCLLMVILGLWRFDLDRSSHALPGGLRAFHPNGFAFVSVIPQVTSSYDPRYWLGRLRSELSRRSRLLLPLDQANLLSGILYGDRQFSKAQKETFRRAGLLHIVAVSGSNVTILVCLIVPFLLWLGCSRRGAFLGLSVGLILFVLFVYPSASVVRAALMGWLVQFAPMVGRLVRPSRLLLVAACLFVVWKPWALMFDVSFALSFLAMGGLLTWGRFVSEWMEPHISSTEIREIISSTVGATVMTVPYSAWAFGQFTIWGLLTNLLVLPVIPWTMLFGAVALFFYRVPLIALPVRGCLEWIGRVAQSVEFLPWKTMSLSPVIGDLFLMYILIFIFFLFLQRKNQSIHKKMDKTRC